MLPRVRPITPVRRKEPFDDPDWLFDLKYDGFRALCYLEQGNCRLISRKGNWMSGFVGLGDQIAASLDVGDAILDGEVIAADETGRPQFYDLLRDGRSPAYVAFDLIWLNGVDLRPLPLTERRQHLQTILPARSAIVSEALSVTGRGQNTEGGMASGKPARGDAPSAGAAVACRGRSIPEFEPQRTA